MKDFDNGDHQNPKYAVIDDLVKAGIQISYTKIETPKTPLHLDVYSGDLESAKLKLQSDPNKAKLQDENGLTPLHIASRGDAINIVKLLLGAGADPKAKDPRGNTPLHIACYFGNIKTARLLLEAKAELNAQNEYGVTPLHMATRMGQLDVVELLLEAGADPNAKDYNELTPLNISDKIKEDNKGLTPLDISNKINNELISEKLRTAQEKTPNPILTPRQNNPLSPKMSTPKTL